VGSTAGWRQVTTPAFSEDVISMAIRTHHNLPLLIPALLMAACATRGPVPTAPPNNSATEASATSTPPATATS
jgi:hypothetical protein